MFGKVQASEHYKYYENMGVGGDRQKELFFQTQNIMILSDFML